MIIKISPLAGGGSGGGSAPGTMVISEIPVDGGTITLPATDLEIILNMSPATDLSTLTVILPPVASAKAGRRLFSGCTKNIGQVTFQAD